MSILLESVHKIWAVFWQKNCFIRVVQCELMKLFILLVSAGSMVVNRPNQGGRDGAPKRSLNLADYKKRRGLIWDSTGYTNFVFIGGTSCQSSCEGIPIQWQRMVVTMCAVSFRYCPPFLWGIYELYYIYPNLKWSRVLMISKHENGQQMKYQNWLLVVQKLKV